ncbi:hypothetical protein Hypma_000124 [Hypsizygus marmoreus]|uniref:Uncharacterized protein n=1 Tax=Hypsizygus marmoreus TaxID=39966 RepID=A0A369KE69_HYPMA|nr:hypothetical protein Hypma_000124 [Hypsizygus marmoreus]
MADVRALLKAKRQEARITHPLASYTQAGQLRCKACGTLVKHASAWEGHIGSKAHRTNVARLREEERVREEQRLKEEAEVEAQKARGKRKAEDQDDESESEAESDEGEKTTKRRKVGAAPSGGAGGFPTDFFSDPSRAALPPASDDSEDEDAMKDVVPAQPRPPAVPPSQIDLEYERFQRELLMLNGQDKRETYERATLFAEPEIVVDQTAEGFPVEEGEDGQTELSQKLDEEAARKQKQQDERELIMDRLLDEERAQEEADMRVTVMKARLEALKVKRKTARASKKAAVS